MALFNIAQRSRAQRQINLDLLITQRYAPGEFAGSSDPHTPDSIKQVVEWKKLGGRV